MSCIQILFYIKCWIKTLRQEVRKLIKQRRELQKVIQSLNGFSLMKFFIHAFLRMLHIIFWLWMLCDSCILVFTFIEYPYSVMYYLQIELWIKEVVFSCSSALRMYCTSMILDCFPNGIIIRPTNDYYPTLSLTRRPIASWKVLCAETLRQDSLPPQKWDVS